MPESTPLWLYVLYRQDRSGAVRISFLTAKLASDSAPRTDVLASAPDVSDGAMSMHRNKTASYSITSSARASSAQRLGRPLVDDQLNIAGLLNSKI
jgi:hypothetical protein